ncbi:MAG TPA: glycosyltransferase family 2 protein [Verrucomicrobiae bacterium]|nr:glycosyltransferase family 2 protein [Verrucomicrobiae bacterium]
MSKVRRKLSVRLLEILPGALAWITFLGSPVLAYYKPAWVAIYIIVFDLYWFLKGGNVAIHMLHSYARLKVHNKIDWLDWCKRLSNIEEFKAYFESKLSSETDRGLRRLYQEHLKRISNIKDGRSLDWNRIYHLILIPVFKESEEVLEPAIRSYCEADYPNDKQIFVLAVEERAGEEALARALSLKEKFKNQFYRFYVVSHPDGLEGEARGKGANCAYAAEKVTPELDALGIKYENVLVSNFDCDTTVPKNYFAHLTFDFMTVEKPHQASYQPMPMFHNNIWEAPAIARVIATASSFWQLVEASRPDRLVTFSSHSMSFKTLVDVGYWRRDLIPEDSYIFWQCFNHFHGDYRTHPLFTTVSMDAVTGDNYIGTLIAQYKQKRRWAWGAIQLSLVFPQFKRDKLMPFWKKLLYGWRLIEGYYFWATASIMITILGWLPLILGGDRFGNTVLASNLPFLTRWIMTLAMIFLVFSMYVNMVSLPPRPSRYSRWRSFAMILQWFLTPIVSSVFGSLPAIDAQTRLMFGRYMEFWVTPKIRRTGILQQPQPTLEREGVKIK